MDLSFLKVIGFEINDECLLTEVHKRCPRNSDRWNGHKRPRPASNKEFVDFMKYCISIGFNGEIIPCYYNEPLSTPDRIMVLMDTLPECKFYLWTNGVLLKDNEEVLKRMNRIMVTRYNETDIETLTSLMNNDHYRIKINRGHLDDRINETIKPLFNPLRTRCLRVNWEIDIDYYGNLHMCCGDWRGEIEIGNIQDRDPEFLINRWNRLRKRLGRRMGHRWNEETFGNLPHVCQVCTTRTPRLSKP